MNKGAMSRYGTYTGKPHNYQYGTAAPELEPEKIRKAKQEYIKSRDGDVEALVAGKKKARHEFGVLQVVFLSLALAAALVSLVFYIVQLSANHDAATKVESLKKEYQTLVQDNALIENEILKSINYTAIYEYATEELGMALPEKQQVIRYDSERREYVEKAGTIPDE